LSKTTSNALQKRAGAALAIRCFSALVGGYAAAAGLASLLARLLPIDRVEATLWGMLAAFVFYAALGLWAFHEPRLWRVTGIIWGIALLSGATLFALGVRP